MSESQWVIIATTIAGFIVTEWRASRSRRWAKEDAEAAVVKAAAERKAATAEIIERAKAEAEATRIKTEIIADSLRVHTERTAARLREEARIGADALVQDAAFIAKQLQTVTAEVCADQKRMAEDLAKKVDEATTSAKSAYTEANHVNTKIEDLNNRLLAEEKRRSQTTDVVGDETTEKKIEKIEATTDRIEVRQIEKWK